MTLKITAILAGLLLYLGWAGLALADNGPHGGYAAMTDKCAACHRAHTAQFGDSLLTTPANANDKSAFCYSCHSGGTGAYTDVKNGLFITTASVLTSSESTTVPASNRPLMGGGFENVRMNAALTGTLYLPATSKHMVTGGTNTVWGYGELGSNNAGATGVSLTCTDCHNPHGKAGSGNTPTYRILKGNNVSNSPLFANGIVTKTASVDVPDETYQGAIPDDPATKDYYIEATNRSHYYTNGGAGYTDSYFAQHVESTSGCTSCHPTHGSVISVYARLTVWCAQCHTRYHASETTGSGHTDSGDTIFKFRHRTNLDSPPSGNSDCKTCHRTHGATPRKTYPGCLTCHVAHGTGARMGEYGGEVAWPDTSTIPSSNERSSLLRLDNRGVCMQCHPWGTGQEGY